MAAGRPVLAVVGPTASGKSAAALAGASAPAVPVEVVAVDAFTVYRGMDIGTAKPSSADRTAVRHHCVDLLDPTDEVDVAWFQGVARAAIDEVHGRGHVPLLVGGSGLYFRAVVDDMRFAPTDPQVRSRIERRWTGRPEAAHAAVTAADPAAGARIQPGNLRRSVRALEVMELTGRPFSDFADTAYASVVGDLRVTYLEPPAAALRAAITARAEGMVAGGLVDELAGIRATHGQLSATAAQAIGYGEAAEVLDGHAEPAGLAARIAARTWSYARRQRSWFRRDPRCAAPVTDVAVAVARLHTDLLATTTDGR